jgi:hypothetical protein
MQVVRIRQRLTEWTMPYDVLERSGQHLSRASALRIGRFRKADAGDVEELADAGLGGQLPHGSDQ